jgi:hypothetical protein
MFGKATTAKESGVQKRYFSGIRMKNRRIETQKTYVREIAPREAKNKKCLKLNMHFPPEIDSVNGFSPLL